MWINPETREVFTLHSEIRAAFPGFSFPAEMSEGDIAFAGLVPVEPSEPPQHSDTHSAVQAPPELVNGAWRQVWASVPKPAPTVADFDKALTDHLDATAKQRRYESRVTCALRAAYSGPFQAEGRAFAQWMDECNALAYQLLAELEAGTRPWPVTTQALIDELPAMVWPQEA